jgi:hypothetical protein
MYRTNNLPHLAQSIKTIKSRWFTHLRCTLKLDSNDGSVALELKRLIGDGSIRIKKQRLIDLKIRISRMTDTVYGHVLRLSSELRQAFNFVLYAMDLLLKSIEKTKEFDFGAIGQVFEDAIFATPPPLEHRPTIQPNAPALI